MKKIFKPRNIAFYFLMLLAFFILGLFYAWWIEAGKGQMLAGGAIVLGYGVVSGAIGFISSFFIANYIAAKAVVRSNWVLLLFILGTFAFLYFKSTNNPPPVEGSKIIVEPPGKTTGEVIIPKAAPPKALLTSNKMVSASADFSNSTMEKMGMGFFAPNFYEYPALFFYGNLTPGKSISEHMPTDSITFKRNKYNSIEISTAPPWLVPDHMKLDYDMLYFKIISVSQEFIEVLVNTQTNRTAMVSRRQGKLIYWPEFLLSVHSVEFIPDKEQAIREKPLDHAGIANTKFAFLHPILIKGKWMKVELLNDDLKIRGYGWIEWEKDGELMVMYNLLS